MCIVYPSRVNQINEAIPQALQHFEDLVIANVEEYIGAVGGENNAGFSQDDLPGSCLVCGSIWTRSCSRFHLRGHCGLFRRLFLRGDAG
jgi:hypothetical protein